MTTTERKLNHNYLTLTGIHLLTGARHFQELTIRHTALQREHDALRAAAQNVVKRYNDGEHVGPAILDLEGVLS